MSVLLLVGPFLFVGASLIGIVLLWQGLWPGRRGDAPHCKRCDYNLTGLAGAICPECGTPITPQTLVYGERYRRPRLAAAGTVLLVFGLVFLVGVSFPAVRSINWYQYRPTALVLWDLQQPDAARAQRAWQELQRRERADRLTEQQRSKLIDLCLQEQTKGLPNRPFSQQMLDYLGRCYLNNLLSDQQKHRLYEQVASLELHVRPRVILGDPVPYEVRMRGVGPGPGVPSLWVKVELGSLCVDGRRIFKGPLSTMCNLGWNAGGAMASLFACKRLGRHTIRLTPAVKLFRGPYGQEASSELCFKVSIPLHADFEVVEARSRNSIERINEPALKEALLRSIQPHDLAYKANNENEFVGIIRFTAPPVNVAFDVFGRIGDNEFKIGSVYKAKGQTGQWQLEGLHSGPAVQSMDIILRSSEAVARKTPHLFEIWDGELIYDDVPIERPTSLDPR